MIPLLPPIGRDQITYQFNNPTFTAVKLTAKQQHQIGCLNVHRFRKEGGLPVASWYADYQDGPFPARLEVFRVRATKDGETIYEVRNCLKLPAFITRILGD